jgi:hypothetical protein
MDHLHAALDPRKQELLEARFLGARVSQIVTLYLQKSRVHTSDRQDK